MQACLWLAGKHLRSAIEPQVIESQAWIMRQTEHLSRTILYAAQLLLKIFNKAHTHTHTSPVERDKQEVVLL